MSFCLSFSSTRQFLYSPPNQHHQNHAHTFAAQFSNNLNSVISYDMSLGLPDAQVLGYLSGIEIKDIPDMHLSGILILLQNNIIVVILLQIASRHCSTASL